MSIRFLAAICALLLISGPSAHAEGLRVHLKYASFDPLAGEPAVLAGLRAKTAAGTHACHLVQFAGPVQDSWRTSVENLGGEILDYIPDFAYAVLMTPEAAARIRSLDCVRWVGLFHPAYRIDPDLMTGAAVVTANIALIHDQPSAGVLAEIERMGGTVKRSDDGARGAHLRAVVPRSGLARLARLPGVLWIERYVEHKLYNDVSRGLMGVPTVWSGAGLYGAGEIVAVCDTGLDTGSLATLSADFSGRVIATYDLGRNKKWDDPNGHGTHVAGSVLGCGALSGSSPSTHSYGSSFAGVAPESRLVFQSVLDNVGGLSGLPTNLNDLFQPTYDNGARVHTNSWGSAVSGLYTTDARNLDLFAWNHKDMTILASAGNEAIDGNSNGVVDSDSIGSPGTAKNCITVGASENYRLFGGAQGTYGSYWSADFPANPIKDDKVSNNSAGTAAFSARGPTNDDRIKPDVVAPGTNVISCRSHVVGAGTGWAVYNTDYVYNGGTSMSTPLVAGSAALVRQYYRTQRSHLPSSALVKGTIINGATELYPGQYGTGGFLEIPTTRPNNVEGWGRVNPGYLIPPSVGRVLEFVDNSSGLTTGASANYSYYVNSNSSPLRITLIWTDYPASTTSAISLVNDLDLLVTLPSGSTLRGNGTTDRRNNVEGVDIAGPATGYYTVRVTGYNVPYGPQPFALVVSGPIGLPLPTAAIGAPANGTVLAGSVTISGTAADPGFQSYVLEYGAGTNPSAWIPIGAAHYTAVQNAVLGTWDTSRLDDGAYTVRLRVTGTGGISTAQTTLQLLRTSLNAVKNNPNGTTVTLTGKIVSAAFADALYVQEPGRTGGIRVGTTAAPAGAVIGSTVTIVGTLGTTNGERVIINPTVTVTADAP